MSKRLTPKAIERARVARGESLWLADDVCPGLRVRVAVTQRGVRRASFTYRYRDRLTNKLKQQSLGVFSDSFGLSDARKDVERLRLVANSGQNVRQHVREQQRAAATSEDKTIAALVERFLEYMARRKRAPRTISQYRSYLRAVTHNWGDMSPADIRRGDAVELIDRVIVSGVPGSKGNGGHRAGGLVLAAGSAFWSWCVEREYAEINPFSGLKKLREETASGISRRTLDIDEIKAVLAGAQEHMPRREATVVLMLLATGLRPTEVCGAQWREIDLRTKTWAIPAERMKHKRSGDHVVYLSDFAAELLKTWRKTQRGRPRYVFPSEGKVHKHVVPDALRHVFDDIEGMKDKVTPKVFRATVRTQLQALGCPDEVRSRISHHQRQSRVEQSYDHHRYDAEAKAWWQKWGEVLDKLQGGKSNVVALPGSASHGQA